MPKTLLLADDSVVIQKLVGLSFANEDVELVTTDNGDDAIAKAREVKPDIVLADVVMPGKNGYEVCEAIRREPDLRNTPVLLLTGTFEAFDESRAQEAGSNGHITKPFEAQALVTRVKELLAEVASAPDLGTNAPAGAGATNEEGFDFFDDGVTSLAGEPGMDLTATSPPRDAAPANDLGAGQSPVMDQSFDFGDDLGSVPSAPDLLDDSLSLEAGNEPGDDQTVALMPGNDLDGLMGEPSQQSPTLTDVPSPTLTDVPSPTLTDALSPTLPDVPTENVSPPPPTLDDLDIDVAPSGEPMGEAIDDDRGLTILDEAGFNTALRGSEPTTPATDLDLSSSDSGSATTIIMSDGETSSDGIAFGDVRSPVTNLDDLGDDLAELAATGSAEAAAPSSSTPNPTETVLADDLFDTNPASMEVSPTNEAPPTDDAVSATGRVDDSFDFGTSEADIDTSMGDTAADPLAGMSPAPIDDAASSDEPMSGWTGAPQSASDSVGAGAPLNQGAPLTDASGYDVSSSDLGDPFAAPYAAPDEAGADNVLTTRTVDDEAMGAAEAPSVSEGLSSGSGSVPTGVDISPVMRDRIHETLERVAWEAFADLSETMVKQVLERVESIAWEVIPQMAEALVKEEIRRMKGEDED